MTITERRERGTELCRRLSSAVAAIAPPGIGRWEKAWQIVGPADSAFMAALTGWEADPTDTAMARVEFAYKAVLHAWAGAASEYEKERQGTR